MVTVEWVRQVLDNLNYSRKGKFQAWNDKARNFRTLFNNFLRKLTGLCSKCWSPKKVLMVHDWSTAVTLNPRKPKVAASLSCVSQLDRFPHYGAVPLSGFGLGSDFCIVNETISHLSCKSRPELVLLIACAWQASLEFNFS